jgi:ectoine hydroxylase-related dioxygenase (phytanoyl-CoA dioxygenase family)
MLNIPALSPNQIESFKNDGFLIVKGAFLLENIKDLSKWTDEVLAMPEETGKQWVYHEKSLKEDDVKLISRIENITPFHNGFRQLTETLRQPVGQLFGEEAVLFKEKINFKMPGGDGFKPHQDSQAGWDIYADFFVSVLVSIDAATTENGCLQICRGDYKRSLFKLWEPLSNQDLSNMKFFDVPTELGDLMFFDSFTPHQSAPNRSDGIRRVYYATYNLKSAGNHQAKYYADKYESYPPDIDRIEGEKYIFRV